MKLVISKDLFQEYAQGRATPREVVVVKSSLKKIPSAKEITSNTLKYSTLKNI